jgi:SHS2 domain-containing protein
MKKFEILEHKADLKIRTFGKDKKQLFSNMLLAMTESQKPEIKSKGEIKRQIKIKSLDLPALLVDFLNEVLYLSQTNKEVYSKIIFKKFTDKEIKGELIGQEVERFGEDIKAATYHNLDIDQKKDKIWQATILFDI